LALSYLALYVNWATFLQPVDYSAIFVEQLDK
jgi:hypothetical protein